MAVRGLRKVFHVGGTPVVALDGVDLVVPRGEFLGVIGRSGAGKSTLIRCINRLEQPTSGRVEVDGRDLTATRGAELRAARRRIGMIFQHFNLLTSRTAADNVALPLEVAGVGRAARRRRAAELLDLVGLDARGSSYPAQLSGGQKQRVGIARALAAEPSVLLGDEATSALDGETTRAVLDLLRDLNRRLGVTILLITHELEVVRRACRRVALLEHGRIVEEGALGEIVARPGSAVAAGLLPAVAPPPRPAGEALVDVVLFDEQAALGVVGGATGGAGRDGLVAAALTASGAQAEVVAAALETIGGRRVGRLALALPGGADDAERLVAELRARGAWAEAAAVAAAEAAR